ncbi:MAG TPA: helix-turn-helix domain-containing protein [Chthonomonadaceae bacterium]|nr:helix-turn-helix domain-containing protein [Chthonomonadaceae bacterium]
MEEYLSVQEAAALKAVSVSAVYRAIREGRLPAIMILGRKAIKVDDIKNFDFGTYTTPDGQTMQRARLPRGANSPRHRTQASSGEDGTDE